jgi:hypothetical protein
MGQSIFINFDSESLTGSRCRAADDLRSRKFSPMVAGDSLVFDLFLTGVDGLLNIQNYSVVRMGVGNLNARPESGTYSVGAVSLDYNNSAADLETAIETATGNGCAVVQLSPFVFKVTFDAVGAQTIPSIDESDLTPRSTVDRQTLQTGDATTREIWLWRLYANPIAFTDVFVDVAGNGAQGTLALSTAGIYDLLGDNSSVKTFFEIELTDSAGDIVTVMQTEIVLTGEVIGTGFSGYIPAPTGLSGDIQSFLASADNEQARDRLGVEDVSAVWGNITGTLSDQTDLQNEFDAKAFIADPTFTGTVTIPTADITTANISTANIAIADFNPNADGGELSWNNVEKTLNLVTGSDNVTIQVGQEVVLYARNTSGVQMIDGQVVKVIGSQGNNPTIALAQADTPANARGVIGVVTQIIPNNSNGFISLIGKVRDLTLDSGTYTVGDLLYLSNTVAGGLTKVRPDIGVAIGRVIATSNGGNNAGVLEVSIDSEVAVHELEQSIPHNTDAVIICNQGDDIQAKHGEAVLLTPNGNPKSATNRATLLVMTGTYGDLIITGSSYTDIVGIGMPTLGSVGSTTAAVTFVNFENFICESLNIVELSNSSVIKNIKCTDLLSVELNYGIIRDCEVSKINLIDNFGTIQNIKVTGIDTFGAPFKISNINWGIIDNVRVTQADQKFFVLINAFSIRDCYGSSILSNCYNYGVVDGCEASSTTGSRSFCGSSAGGNLGTIRNCRSRSAGSFGGQSSTGVTENCVGLAQSFAANSDFIDWGYDNTDMGVAGSFINCTGGNNSFFGVNLDAVTQRTIEASFINCTAGTQSFGWVVTLDAITIWNGYASNCKAGENSFCSAALVGGTGKIEAGAIIENCSAGAKSFATFGNSTNEGYVLRCRSTGIGAQAFSATATGKVRLCLDGNFDEVNLG